MSKSQAMTDFELANISLNEQISVSSILRSFMSML